MLRKIATAVVARSGGALAGVLVTLVVVRVLPRQESGFFLLAFTVLNFLRPVSTFGTDTLSLRHIGAAYEFGHWADAYGHSLKTLLLVSYLTAALSLAVWLLAPFLAETFWEMPEMTGVLRIAAFAVLPMALTLSLSSFFQAIQQTVTAVCIVAVNVSAVLCAVILAARFSTASAAVLALVVVSWANLLFALAWWFWLMRGHAPRMPFAGDIMGPALAIWVSRILTTTTKWNGQIIAAGWVSATDIAYLAVAQRLSLAVSFIMIAINLVTAPKFAALHSKNDIPTMQYLASKTTYLMIGIGLAVFAGIVLFSGPAMGYFGKDFRGYGNLLVILATAQLINAVTGSSGYMLIMGGHQAQYRNLIMASTGVSVLLSFLLIPSYGITGAALATAIGVSSQHIGAAAMVKRYLGINIYQRPASGGKQVFGAHE